jgi:hypothetical protein
MKTIEVPLDPPDARFSRFANTLLDTHIDRRFAETKHHRHPGMNAIAFAREVLAVFGEPRRMGHMRPLPSFETPRKRAAPQDDGR